tara:strand:+ start:4287 stop:5288 length:1002 start_codon:yes stop_codon:yes gene_type:complete
VSFIKSLEDRASAIQATLAFPELTDPRTAVAVARLLEQGVCSVTAVGYREDVLETLASVGIDTDIKIIDPTERSTLERYTAVIHERFDGSISEDNAIQLVQDPLMLAGLLVSEGAADGVVAGAIHPTPDVIRAAVRTIGTDEGVDIVSSAFYMLVPSFRGVDGEVLTFSDAGVIPEPTPNELADIGIAAARARGLIVNDEPRVAFLSYSTHSSASGPAVEKVIEAVAIFRQRFPEVQVDGELQGDAALIESVARSKAPRSSVAGKANVLIFPDLNSANIAYKLVQRITGCRALGPILQGLRRPYNDLSRGSSSEEIFDVSCITALMGKSDGSE